MGTVWRAARSTVHHALRTCTVTTRGVATASTSAGPAAGWETVIGLELHVQVDSATKLFSGALRVSTRALHPAVVRLWVSERVRRALSFTRVSVFKPVESSRATPHTARESARPLYQTLQEPILLLSWLCFPNPKSGRVPHSAAAPTSAGAPPNSNVALFDASHPGTLPVRATRHPPPQLTKGFRPRWSECCASLWREPR
jgi:hypothetical protein